MGRLTWKRKVYFSKTIVPGNLKNCRPERLLSEIIGGSASSVYIFDPFFGDTLSSSKKVRISSLRAGIFGSRQFLNLLFKTIGVVIACLQSFRESVGSALRKVERIIPLLLQKGTTERVPLEVRTILSDEDRSIVIMTNYSPWFIATEMFAKSKTSDSGASTCHGYIHSKKFLHRKDNAPMAQRNQITSTVKCMCSRWVTLEDPSKPSLNRGTYSGIISMKDENLADSLNRSPLKHRRAGPYEKGDYNQ